MAGLHVKSRGFSLIEVLVALVVCSIGLLGLAKMESLALSSTNVAGTRALAALNASSLASMMHANRGYWGGPSATTNVTVSLNSSGAITINDTGGGLLTSSYVAAGCVTPGGTGTSCSNVQIAATDLYNWASWAGTPSSSMPASLTTALNTANGGNGGTAAYGNYLPGFLATIACTQPATATALVVACTITITWAENAVAVNSQQTGISGGSSGGAFTATQAPTYTLYVEP